MRSDRQGYKKFLYRLSQARIGVIGLGMVSFVLAVALLSPFLSPQEPLEQDLQARLRPPFWDEKTDPKYLMAVEYRSSHHRADGGVHAWGIAPAGQHRNLLHLTPLHDGMHC